MGRPLARTIRHARSRRSALIACCQSYRNRLGEHRQGAVKAWPDECEGAYICFLANPQNLDISKLVGSGVEASPFYLVLATKPPPRVIMVRATSVMITGLTPTHLPT